MKVLFATKNPAKIARYYDKLNENGIELITIKDLDINLDINENGKNCLENAYIKAKAYYDATQIITIGMDDNLFIEELPEEKQPGTHVRRVKGKNLSDIEMIEYYSNLAKEYGGKLTSKWVYGMVIYDGKEKKEMTWSKSDFYIIDKPCDLINKGYPLDSISIVPGKNKYFAEMTLEEKNEMNKNIGDDKAVRFILNSLK